MFGCRTMLDGSAAGPLLDGFSEEELLAGGAAWPCTWMLLQPSIKGPRHQSPLQPIAVPLRIDNVRNPPAAPAQPWICLATLMTFFFTCPLLCSTTRVTAVVMNVGN